MDEPQAKRTGWRKVFLLLSLGLILLLGAVALTTSMSLPLANPWAQPTQVTLTGRVVDLDGNGVGGATVITLNAETTTDDDGWFQVLGRPNAQWVTVDHPAYLSRTRAAHPDSPVLFRLTPDDGETIAIHFVGDTMFGRRFYDPNEDGDTSDGLLPLGAGVREHLALLEHVQPLLENANLTAINLETPLVPDSYYDPTRPRPERFHPTATYIISSDPAAAGALREAGVDIIGLANDHIYDLLDEGVTSTLTSLMEFGFRPGEGFFGAGLSSEEAWLPAVKIVKGQSIAFLGCTTIVGVSHEIRYAASDVKGGAAGCDEDIIRRQVAQASETYSIVVFMIHGGEEYNRAPQGRVRQMTSAAREAGATLVINHHPHVVGGFDWNGSSLIAWTLGNFLFDQTVWPSFETYLLAVHLRRGEVIRAYAEPLMIAGYLPKGVTGDLADYVARGAAGREPGPFLVEDGAMEVDIRQNAVATETTMPLEGEPGTGTIFRLDEGWWVSAFTGEGDGNLRPGRDLLWTGSFEDGDVDPDSTGGALWDFDGPDKRTGADYAYEGTVGARIQRQARNQTDVILSPLHRIMIEPVSRLSVTGMVRTRGNAGLSLQLSWYSDLLGLSDSQTVERLTPRESDTWEPFRLDVTAPPGAVAVGLFLRLVPPERGAAYADFDNIRLIEWAADGFKLSPLYDHVRVFGSVKMILRNETLPGAEQWRGLNFFNALRTGLQ